MGAKSSLMVYIGCGKLHGSIFIRNWILHHETYMPHGTRKYAKKGLKYRSILAIEGWKYVSRKDTYKYRIWIVKQWINKEEASNYGW